MPKRSYSGAGAYRYGFNGKENDNDVKGLGNQQDYGMRIYDPRIGRFLSVDPLRIKFPYYTTYQFAANTPLWASDLDGLEPNFAYKGNGINGVGLFDQSELGSIKKHQTKILLGSPGKQFQIEWLLSNDGEIIGYLASRIIPEEDFKMLYGGTGKGVQPAYVIERSKFFEFGKDLDEYYHESWASEMSDVLYGEIERDPVKRFFDPRSWLLGRVGGITGKMSAQLFLKVPVVQRMAAKAYEFTKLETLSGNQSSRVVGDYMTKMKAGQKIEPIEVFEYNGKKYVLNGNHRMEAARRLGIELEYKTVSLDDIIKSGMYKSKEEILNAAAEASTIPNKLNNKLVNEGANK